MRFKLSCAILLCCAAPLAQAQGTVATEATLQAALLYNFAVYTDWPSLRADKIEFCVMGDAALHEALTRLQNRQIKGKALSVKAIATAQQAASCQVLFVGQEEHPRIHEISLLTRALPVLLVAEEDDFNPNDVIIALRLQDGRYSFKIYQTGARTRSLVLSSNLLKLAAQVN